MDGRVTHSRGRGRVGAFALLIALTSSMTSTVVPAWSRTPAPPAPSHSARATVSAPAPLVITTTGGVPVVSKDDYVTGTLQLDGVTHSIEIKGRGNSTWKWPKKPYKVKLEESAALVGTLAQEEWVLLANYADRSALRTQLAFSVAAATGLAWTPQSRYVDVVLNGQSVGLYLLTEQVEQGEGRVELPEDSYLLEVDARFRQNDEPGFRSKRGTPISFKDPDELTPAERKEVKGAIREFEDVLYGPHFADPQRGYPAYVDVAAFVDWYLVEELFANQDSNFVTSVFVSWTPGGDFALGPVWDFDLSAGTKWLFERPAEGWHTRLGTHWIARMFEDPAFAARVKARWAELRPSVEATLNQIPATTDAIRTSAVADWALWHTGSDQVRGSVHAGTFDGEVAYLDAWLRHRVSWLSRPEAVFGRTARTLRERPRLVSVPVRLLGGGTEPVHVRYRQATPTVNAQTQQPQPATLGSDFLLGGDGTLVFAPGESTKTIPITLPPDDLPEGLETIDLELFVTEGPGVVGSVTPLRIAVMPSDQVVDVEIAAPRRGFAGNQVYNRTGRGQVARARSSAGRDTVFRVRVGNDGTVRNTVRVRGSRIGARGAVRYRFGGRDITRAVTSTRGWAVSLPPGGTKMVRAVLTVPASAKAGARLAARVRTQWRGDVRTVDTVRAVVRVKR